MPNWTYNQVSFSGPDTEEIIALMGEDFDFNNIVPMPPELNIESGSNTDRCLVVYLTDKLAVVPTPIDQQAKIKLLYQIIGPERVSELYVDLIINQSDKTLSIKDIDKMFKMGRQYANNHVKYGAVTWYEWCWSNWGVKWPASECSLRDEEYSFHTPWDVPHQIYKKLSEMFPDTEIEVYAEYEDREKPVTFIYKGGDLKDVIEF